MNKLGFGFLRIPQLNRENMQDNTGRVDANIDYETLNAMVDEFLGGGGKYFDTAYTYMDGASEEAIRKSLVERYPRDAYQLADKIPSWYIESEKECEKYFNEQCKRCGVTWFDAYLLHWLNYENYAIAEKFKQFEFLQKLKEDGKAKKIGFSYHGDAKLLDEILTKHPEVDVVQLQINYLDWDDEDIDSKGCYEVAVKHGKEIVVMEPVKGGTLANLPDEAMTVINELSKHEQAADAIDTTRSSQSPASYAIRFAASLDKVSIVLSGMNTVRQLKENMRDMPELSDKEFEALDKVAKILSKDIAVPCTACRYCESSCPKNIAISDFFRIYNSYSRHPEEDWKLQPTYNRLTFTRGKASECVACRLCEKNCPQGIKISEIMPKISDALEW